MFWVFETIAFEPVAVIFPIYEDNTCALESMCYQTLLRYSDLTKGDVSKLHFS